MAHTCPKLGVLGFWLERESRGNGSEGAPAGGCRELEAALPGSRGRTLGGVWGKVPENVQNLLNSKLISH